MTCPAPPHFLKRKEELENFFSQISENDPLREMRQKGWMRFLELGLPERKADAFQYLPLSQLYGNSFTEDREFFLSSEKIVPYIYPECKDSLLVFVNGFFSKELSSLSALPKQVVILSLEEAARSYGAFLNQRFAKAGKEEKDPFAALNMALHKRGAFVFIPPKLHLERPIQCLHLLEAKEGEFLLVSPRIQVLIGAEARAEWISSTISLSPTATWSNAAMDVAVEERGWFHLVSTRLSLPREAWHFDALRATLKRQSHFQGMSMTKGARAARQDIRLSLMGEEAFADLQGIWMLEKMAQAHTHVHIDHIAPRTHSMQRFKGVLEEFSQSSFQGKIRVEREAQKTQAYQLNHNMLLGERAIANSKPNLEIFADDVKASHGATVSQLDPHQLFYLKSRGFSEKGAKALLVSGFCKEIVSLIPHRSVRLEVEALLKGYLAGGEVS